MTRRRLSWLEGDVLWHIDDFSRLVVDLFLLITDFSLLEGVFPRPFRDFYDQPATLPDSAVSFAFPVSVATFPLTRLRLISTWWRLSLTFPLGGLFSVLGRDFSRLGVIFTELEATFSSWQGLCWDQGSHWHSLLIGTSLCIWFWTNRQRVANTPLSPVHLSNCIAEQPPQDTFELEKSRRWAQSFFWRPKSCRYLASQRRLKCSQPAEEHNCAAAPMNLIFETSQYSVCTVNPRQTRFG